MKKVLTLVLALVFVLALAAPAMAFTGDTTPLNPTPYTLKIYLVEHQSEDIFTGWIGLPAVDRGYAKNETVAAVVELKVPKGEAPLDNAWLPLEIRAKNATFRILKNGPDVNADTPKAVLNTSANAAAFKTFTVNSDTKLTNDVANNYAADNTFKWLVFAYVTGDDASITAKLAEAAVPNIGADFVLNGKTYKVTKNPGETAPAPLPAIVGYRITSGTGIIDLLVDSDNKSTGMVIYSGGALPAAIVNHGNPFEAYIDGVLYGAGSTNTTYVAAKKLYDDVVVKAFGLNFELKGAFLRDKFFTDLVSNKTLVAKVDIKPWTAYVKVPDNVVVNPPKTGAAASILGFVMVALAGASAVALKKR